MILNKWLNATLNAPCPSLLVQLDPSTMVEQTEKNGRMSAKSTLRPRLALYEPDIPQNAGTIFRLGACLDIAIDIIEPAGFDASDRNLKRAGMDYLGFVEIKRHLSFAHFEQWRRESGLRLVLATTKGAVFHTAFEFLRRDIILLGRESAGVPDHVHATADARVKIPLQPKMRSLNIAIAGGILAAEALRQLDAFPDNTPIIA